MLSLRSRLRGPGTFLRESGGGNASPFPFTQDFSTNASLSGWVIPGNASVVGGALVISPTVGPAELLTNPGFEGTYTGGVAPNWTKQGTPTVAESGDVHGGASAQSIANTATEANHIEQAFTPTIHQWYLASVWRKRTAGTGSMRFYPKFLARDNTYPASPAAYTQVIVADRAKVGTASAVELYNANVDTTGLFDDASLKLIALATMGIYRKCAQAAYIVKVDPATIVANTPFGCCVRVDDPANPQNMVSALHDGVQTLVFTQRKAGVVTNLIAPVTIAYNAASKVEIRVNGNTAQLFYGGVQQGTDTAVDASLVNNQYCGILSTYSGNSISTFEMLTNP